jgi:small-conductance mechanosensitive channel
MTMGSTQLHAVLEQLASGNHQPVMWQAIALLASLAIAWLLARVLASRRPEGAKTGLGLQAWEALQVPLIALLFLIVGRAAMGVATSAPLLNLGITLITALAFIRLSVVMLRQVFIKSAWIETPARVFGWFLWFVFALFITGLSPEVTAFLDSLGFEAGEHRISVLLVLQATLSVAATLLIALWLGRFLESRVMGASTLAMNVRVMVSKVAQALLIVGAVVIALPAVGIDVTVLSVFGGMLGVGIGFGLQKIASNYVSGFIILMDRSVSIGDVITVEQHTGQLTKMTARYVVVRSTRGTEALIPNDTIVTTTVVNHSYTDRQVQLALPVQVSYRSDLDEVVATLKGAAESHPRVLKAPAPNVSVVAFADSGIQVELAVWFDDPDAGVGALRSDLYFKIWREFRARGIEVPYPQREVRILGGAAAPVQA